MNLNVSDIPKRYLKKSIPSLKKILERRLHKFIRSRDEGLPCISCGLFKKLQAGHFYSAGKFSRLKFDEDNIHGQCLRCNYYGGNEVAIRYRERLIKRIGIKRVHRLDRISQDRTPFKWDRFYLIEKILKYNA